jgi:hypothetical protein
VVVIDFIMIFLLWLWSLALLILFAGGFYGLCCAIETFFGMAAVAAVLEPMNAYAIGDARGLAFAIVGVFTDVPSSRSCSSRDCAHHRCLGRAVDDLCDVVQRVHAAVLCSAVVAEVEEPDPIAIRLEEVVLDVGLRWVWVRRVDRGPSDALPTRIPIPKELRKFSIDGWDVRRHRHWAM